jgi:transcriptional regulator with XRE-family HTH domain
MNKQASENWNWAISRARALLHNLRDRRRKLGMTSQQLHEATGVSLRSITSYEHARSFPTLLNYQRIVLALDVFERGKEK